MGAVRMPWPKEQQGNPICLIDSSAQNCHSKPKPNSIPTADPVRFRGSRPFARRDCAASTRTNLILAPMKRLPFCGSRLVKTQRPLYHSSTGSGRGPVRPSTRWLPRSCTLSTIALTLMMAARAFAGAPPTLQNVQPLPGTVTALTQVIVTFSEPVTNVVATDLLANDDPASAVAGSGAVYTFTLGRQ